MLRALKMAADRNQRLFLISRYDACTSIKGLILINGAHAR